MFQDFNLPSLLPLHFGLLKSTVTNVPVDPWTVATDWQILMLRSLALEWMGRNHQKPETERVKQSECKDIRGCTGSLGCLDLMLQPNIIPELGEESVLGNGGKAAAAMLWLCRKAEKQLGSNYFKPNTSKNTLLNHSMAICFVLRFPVACSVHDNVGTRLPLMSLYQITPWSEGLHGITVSLSDPIL